MAIKLMSNSISMGKGAKTLAQLIEDVQNKKQAAADALVKTASVVEETPVAPVEEAKVVVAEKEEEKKEEKCECETKKEEVKEEKAEDKKEEKEAKVVTTVQKTAATEKFVKIAKLDDHSKKLLRAEFEAIYPKEYVDAMLAE